MRMVNLVKRILIACLIGITILGVGAVLFFAKPPSGVRGDLVYLGGPNPRAIRNHPEPGEVVAWTRTGHRVASVSFGEDEGFQLALDPGTYELVPRSGDARCQSMEVSVPSAGYVDIRFQCGVL
jgi:hypothetical protein